MGREEITIIGPAIEALRAEGIDVVGPLPADTMFHPKARARYDVALTMYHDQGLIPVKTLAFDEGVNVTLGLPFVRTSPDHGTAFDIAGQGGRQPGEPDRGAQARRPIDAMSLAADGLPPLARSRRRAWARTPQGARPEFPVRSQPDPEDRARRGAARQASPWSRSAPAPGVSTRALLSEGAGKVIAIERDARCARRAGRDRRALAGTARDHRGRRAARRAPDADRQGRRPADPHRRQPALQHRRPRC